MERQDFIDSLKQLADIYERNPQLEVPTYMPGWWIFTYDAETFIKQIAAFGNGAKKYNGDNIEFIPNIQFDLKIQCQREQICVRKVVGKKMVPEKTVPAVPAQVIPAHEEDVVEWECKPVLAAKKQSAENTEPELLETAADLVTTPFPADDIPF